MKHPEILLLPVLMFTDYYLTVFAAILKDKKYSEHFKTQHYELNPNFQKEIGQKRWFSPRHILITLVYTSFYLSLVEFVHIPDYFIQMIFGFLFVFYGTLIGRHVSNIVYFREVSRRPDELSGQISTSHSLLLSLSMVSYLVVAVPMVIVAIFNPTPFILGGLGGVLWVFFIHYGWIERHKKAMESLKEAVTKAGEQEY